MLSKTRSFIDQNSEKIFFFLTFFTINICDFVKNIYFIFAIGLLFLIYSIRNNISFTKEKLIYIFSIILIIIFSVFNNSAYSILSTVTIKTVIFFLIMILVSFINKFDDSYIKYEMIFGYIHVIATYLFLIFPSLYKPFANAVYGYFPVGTDNGMIGYTAGLSSHYSANALYITFCLLATLYFVNKYKEKKSYKILFLLALGALFLTTKRAHLLFSIISILTAVILKYRKNLKSIFKNILKKMPKYLIASLIILLILYLLFPDIINSFISRLDDGTSGRTAYWEKAFEWFLTSPLLGIGWLQFGFKYRPFINGNVMNVHNVYIQVLCECGIIGLLIFLLIIFIPLKNTIINYLKNKNEEINYYVLICQIFFILYCLTGNCIYDNTLLFYAIVSGLAMASFNINKK